MALGVPRHLVSSRVKLAYADFILRGHNSLHHFGRVYYTPGRLVPSSRPLPNLMPVFSLQAGARVGQNRESKIKSSREMTENVLRN